MITPSGVTSSAYWDAIKAGNPSHVRITFLGQDIVLTDADIEISDGVSITDILNGETDLVFGKAVCKQVRMTILNSDHLDGLIWTGEFQLEMGVEINSSTEWVTIGYFTGEKPRNVTTVETIEFTAYDRMTKFDILADDFVKGIAYPATVQTIYNNLCAFVGITKVSGDELPNIMSRSFASAPMEMQGYTCRDVLSWIAEACGCYAKIDNDGNCKMVWFIDNTGHDVTEAEEFGIETADIHNGLTWDVADTYTWDEIGNMTWNDVCGYGEAYSIDQILVKQVGSDLDINYPYPYGGNVYMIVENPFLPIGSGTELNNYIKPIYDRLVAFGGYLPVKAECVGNWCVEAGDIITLSVNGSNISFPIFCKTMHWDSSINDEYETTGNNERAIYTSEKSKQKVIESNKIELYVGELRDEVDQNYYKVRSGIAIKPEGIEISGGKYVKIKSGGSFVVDSGNFEIDEYGNATFGGELTSPSGSIGGFTINGDKLESGVFTLDAANKEIKAGNWYFGQAGLSFNNPDEPLSLPFVLNNYNVGLEAGKVGMYIREQYWDNNYVNQLFFAIPEPIYGSSEHYTLMLQASKTSSSKTFMIYMDVPDGVATSIGAPTRHISHIYVDEVHYGTLSQFSSREVKHNIKPLQPMGETIDKLVPVSFVYDDDDTGKERMGMIYEDTVDVMPEICLKDTEDNKAINYVELIPVLLKEIQDLRERVKNLEGGN